MARCNARLYTLHAGRMENEDITNMYAEVSRDASILSVLVPGSIVFWILFSRLAVGFST